MNQVNHAPFICAIEKLKPNIIISNKILNNIKILIVLIMEWIVIEKSLNYILKRYKLKHQID